MQLSISNTIVLPLIMAYCDVTLHCRIDAILHSKMQHDLPYCIWEGKNKLWLSISLDNESLISSYNAYKQVKRVCLLVQHVCADNTSYGVVSSL